LHPPSAAKFAIAPLSLKTKPPEVMKSQGAWTMWACTCVGVEMPSIAAAKEPASTRAESLLVTMHLLRCGWNHRRDARQKTVSRALILAAQEKAKKP
jgi:hypothetical protein